VREAAAGKYGSVAFIQDESVAPCAARIPNFAWPGVQEVTVYIH
jgi:hypothetical protein